VILKNKKKGILISFIVVLLLLQLYPLEKPSNTAVNPNDLLITEKVPENISTLLKKACYDCHSNESIFPWYSKIAPSKWLVYNHINEGREELNFSEWNTLNIDDKSELLDDISTIILEGEMPLKGYIILHSEANLSNTEREAIASWADEMLESLYD